MGCKIRQALVGEISAGKAGLEIVSRVKTSSYQLAKSTVSYRMVKYKNIFSDYEYYHN